MKRVLSYLAFAAVLGPACVALADLPPEPGWTKVGYSYEVDAVPEGRVIVAYPTYNTKEQDSHAVVLAPGVSAGTWQGYQPALYSLSVEDAKSLPKDDSQEAYLKAHADLCLKHVPRVFQVKTVNKVSSMTDVIHVSGKAGKCEATLAKTIYKGEDEKTTGEGGVDASGNRTPPAPFGKDIPPLGDAGFVLASSPSTDPTAPSTNSSATPSSSSNPASASTDGPKTADPHSGGCAGCSVTQSTNASLGIGAAVFVGIAMGVRRNRRNERNGQKRQSSRSSAD